MEKNSPLPPKPHESGAALIVMVLLALLVLAGLVIVSSNLALGNRRTTTEQKAILPAQLAAESGVAYAKAKLTAANQLFKNMGVPVGTTKASMYTLISNLCPTSASLPLRGTDTQITIPTTTNIKETGQLVCDLSNTNLNTGQISLLSTLMSGSGGKVINSTSTKIDTVPSGVDDSSKNIYSTLGISTDDVTRSKFFTDLFSPRTKVKFDDNTNVMSGLQPLALIQIQDISDTAPYRKYYRLYFRVAGLNSVASVNGARRQIAVAGNNTVHALNIDYTIKQDSTITPGWEEPISLPGTPPTFAGYGLFVNDFAANNGNGGFYDNTSLFSGPFHSNTVMNFRSSNGQSITIDGALTSAGCSSLGVDSSTGASSCIGKKDQVYMNGALKNTSDYSKFTTFKNDPYRYYGNPAIKVKDRSDSTIAPNFNANFVPLPLNNERQRSMAANGGILLNNPMQVQLVASDDYQIINIKTNSGSQLNLRFDSSNKMQIQQGNDWLPAIQDANPSIGWRAARTNETNGLFNGVIFADGDIQSLTGPTRSKILDTTATGGAAISKFAAITVAAQHNVSVTGDLKYATRCPNIDSCTSKGSDGNFSTKNILGIYASDGDIRLPFSGKSYQNTDPSSPLNAPANLEIDAFIMAAKKDKNTSGIGTVQPYNSVKNTNTYAGAGNKGKFIVHGGTVKTKETGVGTDTNGWTENYFFDGRGLSYSPPGFPTTTEGIAGSNSTIHHDGTTTYLEGTIVNGWSGGVTQFNLDGTPVASTSSTTVSSAFNLDNEISQQKAN